MLRLSLNERKNIAAGANNTASCGLYLAAVAAWEGARASRECGGAAKAGRGGPRGCLFFWATQLSVFLAAAGLEMKKAREAKPHAGLAMVSGSCACDMPMYTSRYAHVTPVPPVPLRGPMYARACACV